MQLRHDAPIRIHFTTNGPRKNYDVDTTAANVDGALTLRAIVEGKVSGMDSGIRVQYTLELLDESFALKEGELCTCKERCVPCPTSV